MRYRLITLSFCTALAVGGCSPFNTAAQAATGTIASVAPEAMNASKRGLAAAHLAHGAAADGLTIAANSGVLHGANAVTAKKWLDDSEAYLVAADAMVKLGDAPGIEAKIGAANNLISKVQSAIGSK